MILARGRGRILLRWLMIGTKSENIRLVQPPLFERSFSLMGL